MDSGSFTLNLTDGSKQTQDAPKVGNSYMHFFFIFVHDHIVSTVFMFEN